MQTCGVGLILTGIANTDLRTPPSSLLTVTWFLPSLSESSWLFTTSLPMCSTAPQPHSLALSYSQGADDLRQGAAALKVITHQPFIIHTLTLALTKGSHPVLTV